MKLVAWALAALLAVPAIASADRGDRRARMIEKFDANRDGQLDANERRTAKAVRQAKRIEKRMARLNRFIERFDRNRDGNLGPGEAPPEAQRRLRRLDRDGDGWVRPDEIREGAKQMRGKRGRDADRMRDGRRGDRMRGGDMMPDDRRGDRMRRDRMNDRAAPLPEDQPYGGQAPGAVDE